MKKISIILVNYNGNLDTLDCIKSIKKSNYENYNIIVVDNESKMQNYISLSNDLLHQQDVILIRSDKNLGFAGGNNIGIKYALDKLKSDYVLLLNNDTVIKEDTLSELVKAAEKFKDSGIIGGKIYYYLERNKIWYAGGYINWRRFTTFNKGIGEIDTGQYDEIQETEFITGCTMLIKSEVIEKVGYLPEEYFMYYEDTDYNIQAIYAGYKLYYTPKAVIYHKVSSSTGGEESSFSIEYGTRNRRYFMKKFKNKVNVISYLYSVAFFYLTRLIKIIIYSLKREKEKRKAMFRGLHKYI